MTGWPGPEVGSGGMGVLVPSSAQGRWGWMWQLPPRGAHTGLKLHPLFTGCPNISLFVCSFFKRCTTFGQLGFFA